MIESTRYPKCRMCGQEMAEGWKHRNRPLYLCSDCRNVIEGVAHDAAYIIFEDLS